LSVLLTVTLMTDPVILSAAGGADEQGQGLDDVFALHAIKRLLGCRPDHTRELLRWRFWLALIV
jgi:hypothetical protein